ncbi:MAG: CehA/McbA family metallohydrolase [Clostridia bacterium]|nr:CehA/McbA family metallohydrolase [Clostridia bacterium]
MIIFDKSTSWHKVNLHTHTALSDGKLSPSDAAKKYREHGYGMLAITDHRKCTVKTDESDDFILAGGIELNCDSFKEAGSLETWHIVGIGMPEGYTQKTPINGSGQDLIDEIKAAGGFAILAHPAWSLNTPDHILSLKGIDAVEIWNTQSALPYNPDRADSSAILDCVFNAGMLLPVLASDDTHRYEKEACVAATMVGTDDFSLKGILTAIKSGRSYATTGPVITDFEINEETVTVKTLLPCAAACVCTNHPWLGHSADTAGDGGKCEFSLPVGENTSFLRVAVFDAEGRRAWTNPVKIN